MVYGLIQEAACICDGLVAKRCMRCLEADGLGATGGWGVETEGV